MTNPIRKKAIHRALKTGNKQIFVICSYKDFDNFKKRFHFKTKIYPDRHVGDNTCHVVWNLRLSDGWRDGYLNGNGNK